MRRYLIAGLLVWVPIGITVLVVRMLINLMDRLVLLLPPEWRPDALVGFHVPGIGLILAVITLFVTGLLVANLLGRRLVALYEYVLDKIPLVRSVYSASKSFSEVLFSETNEAFKKVILIEYPRKGLYSLAFMTATQLEEVQARTDHEVVCVFLPTTPNPTSGYILMVPREDAIELDMDVEDALKMIVSLGVVVPEWKKRALTGPPTPAERADEAPAR
jgi:uncharacterized membrane protein